MSAAPSAEPTVNLAPAISWRWVHVGVAALAMVMTLPGRTHGLGLFTEPILKTLQLDRQSYAFINLWATLIGALFCLPCGWLFDRLGARAVYLGVAFALAATVMAMARFVTGADPQILNLPLPDWTGGSVTIVFMLDLFLFVLLTRGFGQSALSVVSLSLIGRSAGRRPGLAMGVYACCVALGFTAAFLTVGKLVKLIPENEPEKWREVWFSVGLGVMILGLVGALLINRRVFASDLPKNASEHGAEISLTLGQALRSAPFWTFTITTCFYGLVVSGTSLFGQSILAERHFDKEVFVNLTAIGVPFGLAANLLFGFLATQFPLHRLIAIAAAGFGVTIYTFPHITTETQVYAYAICVAAAGGAITVCFYTVYRQAFGPKHLGSIQGAAQMLTVLFSAVGPQIFATGQVRFGSYAPLFPVFAGIALALAVACWMFRLPARQTSNPGDA
jgi:MFS family permease